jgi:starch phosphorylase
LENEITREFYERDEQDIPRAWVRRVRASMTQLAEQYSSDRMVREYVEQAYLPAARAYLDRVRDGAKRAADLEQWQAQIDDQWSSLRFGRIHVVKEEEEWRFEVQAYLGDLCPDCVAVQLFAEGEEGAAPACIQMHRESPIHGAVGGYIYRATAPANRPSEHYTARIVPAHAHAFVPLEATQTFWQH